MSKSKKGSLLDWIYLPVMLFIIAVFLIVSAVLVDKVHDMNLFSTNAEANTNFESSRSTIFSMDNMMLFIMVGTSLFVIISGYFAYNHPALFFFSIFILIVAIVCTVQFSNAYETLTGQTTMSEASAHFPKTQLLMSKFPFYIAILGFITAICMYIGYSRNG